MGDTVLTEEKKMKNDKKNWKIQTNKREKIEKEWKECLLKETFNKNSKMLKG